MINRGVLEASNGAELVLKLQSPVTRFRRRDQGQSGSKVVLLDAVIDGGTLVTSGTGVISAGGVFVELSGGGGHGVVNSGALHVASGTTLRTQGVFNNGGTVVFEDGAAALFAGTVNGGTISGAGVIEISGNLALNNGAIIEADTDSRVDLHEATIIGGKLQTVATGSIHISAALAPWMADRRR